MVVGVILSIALTAGAGAAFGFWTVVSEGNQVHAEAGSLGQGATPTIDRARHTVTVSWSATPGALGYEVRRYNAAAGTVDLATGRCRTTTELSCAETDVPLGVWWYAITPVRHLWSGDESARTVVRVTDPVATIDADQLVPVSGGHLTGGLLREFLPNRRSRCTWTPLMATCWRAS